MAKGKMMTAFYIAPLSAEIGEKNQKVRHGDILFFAWNEGSRSSGKGLLVSVRGNEIAYKLKHNRVIFMGALFKLTFEMGFKKTQFNQSMNVSSI